MGVVSAVRSCHTVHMATHEEITGTCRHHGADIHGLRHADPQDPSSVCYYCRRALVAVRTAENTGRPLGAPPVLEQGDQPCECTDTPKPYRLASMKFVHDHAERGCVRHSDVTWERKGREVVVMLRECDALELLSDADHYADPYMDLCMDDALAVKASARSVAQRLRRQGVAG